MMAALGGRLGAYRAAGGDPAALADALGRNLYRGAAVDGAALDWAVARTRALITALAGHDFATLAAGRVTLAA
jgi:cytochrome b pre-mRNA-processing protein 3